MQYIVFITENAAHKINGINRILIGIHKTKDPTIFDGYLGEGVWIQQANTFMFPKSPFQVAVKKYGVQSFRRNILYICDSYEEAIDKEMMICSPKFLAQDHVYNYFIENDCRYQPLYQFDMSGELVKTWNYANEAFEFFGYPALRWNVGGLQPFLNYYWSTNDGIDIEKMNPRYKYSNIYLYSLNGKLLRKFNNLTECSLYLNYGSLDITDAIKYQKEVQGKYYLSNSVTDQFLPKPRRNYIKQVFYVYKSTGEFLGKCVGKQLMKIIDMHSWAKISKIFSVNKNWYKDFYITLEPIDDVPLKTYTASVDVFDKFGNFIEKIATIKEAREKYGVTAAQFKDIQQGIKYVGDYIFKYNK